MKPFLGQILIVSAQLKISNIDLLPTVSLLNELKNILKIPRKMKMDI